ncbi:MAG: tetratricopeptide repeat protein [bacterium]
MKSTMKEGKKNIKNGGVKVIIDAAGVTQGQLSQPENKLSFFQAIISPAILSFITFLVYYPSLRSPFQFDDIANISKNFAIRFDEPLARWWWHSRWFSDWLNRLNFKIGRFDPFSYRLCNVTIHILSGIALFFLIFNLCRLLTKRTFFHEKALFIASMTMALFLLHPVQTQAVSYVIQARMEGLASLFILTTLCFFVSVFVTQNRFVKALFAVLFCVFGALSCGTKEIIAVLPVLMLLLDWFFISQCQWDAFKKHLGFYSIFITCFFVLLVHYLGWGFFSNLLSFNVSIGNNRGNILTQYARSSITPGIYFVSQFKVILHYIFMFIWPFGISVEYDWKLSSGFFTFESFFSFIMLVSLGIVAVRELIKKRHVFISFGLFWFFACISPRVLIPSPELVCDYKTYLASVGLLFIFSVGFVLLFTKVLEFIQDNSYVFFVRRYALISSLAFIIIPLGFATKLRNDVWSTAVLFWEDNVKKAPGKARTHNNYGVALAEAGRIDDAIIAYKKAITLDAQYSDPLSNLAVAHSMKGDIESAIGCLKEAIRIFPDYAEAYNNLGSLLVQKKEYDAAEQMLDRAIKLRPYYGKAFYNKARMYEELGQDEKVYENLKSASHGDLDVPEVFLKFGLICLRLKKYEESAQAFQLTIERGMSTPSAWFNLANSYFMLTQFDKAAPIYEKLAQSFPTDTRYAFNLAETYYSQKQFERALDLFKKSTQLERPMPQAFMRVANCLEQLKQVGQAKDYLNNILAYNAPEDFKKMVRNEVSRLMLQEKFVQGNGSVKVSDINSALAFRKGTQA